MIPAGPTAAPAVTPGAIPGMVGSRIDLAAAAAPVVNAAIPLLGFGAMLYMMKKGYQMIAPEWLGGNKK